MKAFLLFSFFIILLAEVPAQINNKDWNSMVAAEYDFAKSAAEIGTRDAFLKFIADDGILFRPTPVNGKKFLTDSPNRPGILSWFPVYAKMSKDGNMGFTTGPADFKKDKDSAAVWSGNFVTVWQRQADGEWKFVIDFGNTCDQQNLTPLACDDILPGKKKESEPANPISPDELILLDKEFYKSTENITVDETYLKYIGEESRLLRDGEYPITGIENITGYLRAHKNIMRLKPSGGKIASSNDIGFTYGEMEPVDSLNNEEKYNYLRIYKKEGERWMIAIEVVGRIEN